MIDEFNISQSGIAIEILNADRHPKWSGEGAFTQRMIDQLAQVAEIEAIFVEDAPASRSDADYNFISNEIFVGFATVSRQERIRRFGFLPGSRTVTEMAMTVPGLEAALTSVPDIGRARLFGRRDAAVSEDGTDCAAVSDARLQAGRACPDLPLGRSCHRK